MLLSLVGLTLERSQLAVDLDGDVPGPLQVRIHRIELAQRAFLALLVLENACGFLDERAAFFGTRVQNLVETALTDDRVSVAPESGVREQVLDVHETSRRLVDQVLGLPVAEHAARDGDFVELERQRPVGVVEHEVDLGNTNCLPGRGTRENDVFHRRTAELFGALLAKHPEHGVGDVRFAGTVRTHHDGDARLELHRALVGE